MGSGLPGSLPAVYIIIYYMYISLANKIVGVVASSDVAVRASSSGCVVRHVSCSVYGYIFQPVCQLLSDCVLTLFSSRNIDIWVPT